MHNPSYGSINSVTPQTSTSAEQNYLISTVSKILKLMAYYLT